MENPPLHRLDPAAPEAVFPATVPEAPPEAPPASPAPSRPRWHPLVRAAVYIVAVELARYALIFPLSLLAFTLGDRFPADLANAGELALLSFLLSWPPAIGVTVLFLRFLDRRELASIGARWPEGGPRTALFQFAVASLAVLSLLGIWTALILAFPAQMADLRFGGLSQGFMKGPSWWPFPPGLLLALLLAGFLIQGGLEEWIVRGYVYRTLKDRWRPWAAALASSGLFSLLHAFNPSVSALALLNVLLAGMVLAALVERSGSLWSATVAHGVWNFAVSCLLSLPVSGIRIFHLLDITARGDERLTGGGFGPEGSLVLTLLALLLACWLWWPLRARGPSAAADVHPSPETAPSAPEDVRPPAPL